MAVPNNRVTITGLAVADDKSSRMVFAAHIKWVLPFPGVEVIKIGFTIPDDSLRTAEVIACNN
jgi:hypothetical protein